MNRESGFLPIEYVDYWLSLIIVAKEKKFSTSFLPPPL